MDQAKTVLPHQTRNSHETDSLARSGLQTHVVSTVIFGGLIPIIGFVNLPDVWKNSSLTVTNIQSAIEMQ